MLEFDVLVIGSGLSGSILARKIAEEQKKKVLVLERRNHIGGNVYDELDAYGIRIQRYGPHTFHTNNKEVYQFLEKYAEFMPYRVTCSAIIDGMVTPSPFNFTTIHQLYEKEEAEELIMRLTAYYHTEQVPITELLACKDDMIKEFAKLLFEKDYRLYTAKQWGIPADKIDVSVLKRVPILLSYRDYIYDEMFEALPKEGFTSLIQSMLSHKNIKTRLCTDAVKGLTLNPENGCIEYEGSAVPIIYTGAIDELFDFRFGKLPYRSLEIKYEYFDTKGVQDTTLVVHPQEHAYTRTTEYTKLPVQQVGNRTVVAYEYPCEYDRSKGKDPYYPILTEENIRLFNQYKEYAKQFKNLTLCGRLADYKYYNMDQAVEHAFDIYKNIELE